MVLVGNFRLLHVCAVVVFWFSLQLEGKALKCQHAVTLPKISDLLHIFLIYFKYKTKMSKFRGNVVALHIFLLLPVT